MSFKDIAKEAFQVIKQHQTLEGWTKDFEPSDGRKGYWKKLPGSSINGFIAEGPLDVEPKVIADKLWDAREAEWKKYDNTIIEWKLVEEVDATTRVIHQANKLGGFMVWDRDISVVMARFEENGIHYIVQKSVEHPLIPNHEKDKKYVRAKILVSGFIFEPLNGKTRAMRIAHADPSGSLPAVIVNQFRPNEFTLDLKKSFLA